MLNSCFYIYQYQSWGRFEVSQNFILGFSTKELVGVLWMPVPWKWGKLASSGLGISPEQTPQNDDSWSAFMGTSECITGTIKRYNHSWLICKHSIMTNLQYKPLALQIMVIYLQNAWIIAMRKPPPTHTPLGDEGLKQTVLLSHPPPPLISQQSEGNNDFMFYFKILLPWINHLAYFKEVWRFLNICVCIFFLVISHWISKRQNDFGAIIQGKSWQF